MQVKKNAKYSYSMSMEKLKQENTVLTCSIIHSFFEPSNPSSWGHGARSLPRHNGRKVRNNAGQAPTCHRCLIMYSIFKIITSRPLKNIVQKYKKAPKLPGSKDYIKKANTLHFHFPLLAVCFCLDTSFNCLIRPLAPIHKLCIVITHKALQYHFIH